MPQDQVVEEESVEQEGLAFAADEEKAFGAEADGKAAPEPEGKGEAATLEPAVEETKPDGEKQPEKQAEEKKEPTKSESQMWLDQRVGQLGENQPTPSVPPPTAEARPAASPSAPPPHVAQPSPPSPTDWMDAELVVGEQKIKIREAMESDPMTFKVAQAIAENLVSQKLATAGYVTVEQAAQLQAQIQDLKFWGEVGLKHADYAKYVGDNADKGFVEWLNKQPEAYQRLARRCATPQDAIAMLDLYKETIQAAKAAEIDEKRRETKKKTDAMLSGHSGGSHVKDAGANKVAADEEAAFNEEATR